MGWVLPYLRKLGTSAEEVVGALFVLLGRLIELTGRLIVFVSVFAWAVFLRITHYLWRIPSDPNCLAHKTQKQPASFTITSGPNRTVPTNVQYEVTANAQSEDVHALVEEWKQLREK